VTPLQVGAATEASEAVVATGQVKKAMEGMAGMAGMAVDKAVAVLAEMASWEVNVKMRCRRHMRGICTTDNGRRRIVRHTTFDMIHSRCQSQNDPPWRCRLAEAESVVEEETVVLRVEVVEWMVVVAKEAAGRVVERAVAATGVAREETEAPAAQAEKEAASNWRRPMKRQRRGSCVHCPRHRASLRAALETETSYGRAARARVAPAAA